MSSKQTPSLISYIPAALILALVGWAGLVILVRSTLPTLGPRWLFFFLIVIAMAGTFLPVSAFLNWRFPTSPPAPRRTVVRESIMIGLYIASLAWLQLGRVLTPALVLVLALGIGFVEWMIRLRESSRWEP